MAFIPVPQTMSVRLRFNLTTQLVENTLYFQASAGPTTVLATTLATNLVSWWAANFQAQASNKLGLLQVYVTDLSSQEGFTVAHSVGLPLVGGSTVEALPFNCAYCISFRTAFRGRSGRGRNFVTGLTEADQADSTILSARRDAWLTAYRALMGAGTFTAGCEWVVVSRHFNGNPRPAGLARPVSSVVATDNVMDSQRRRLPGRGR